MQLKKRIGTIIASAALLFPLFTSAPSARAFTAADAYNLAFNFNWNFYNSSGGYYIGKTGGSFDKQDFWENAEMIEMAVDVAARTGYNSDYAVVSNLVKGFDNTYGTDWTYDTHFNDDIMWSCIAHLRAWLTVPNAPDAWANNAWNNFYWVYNGGGARTVPQYDSTYGGGMWETDNHTPDGGGVNGTKNACVNGPGAIAGYLIWKVYGSGGNWAYNDGFNLYWWEANKLLASSGLVYDHWEDYGGVDGPVGTGDLSYNVGTFIAAAYFYGHTNNSNLAAQYFMHTICSASYLPNYGTGGDGSGGDNNDGFNGIFMRWMCMYEQATGQQGTYQTWLYNNANAAWNNVNSSSGLSWDDWAAPTPSGTQYSWACSPSVVALHALPPQSQ